MLRVTPPVSPHIANAVEPYRERLPIVTQEIGDTWISGVPSDPLKVARYSIGAAAERMDQRTINYKWAMPPIAHS